MSDNLHKARELFAASMRAVGAWSKACKEHGYRSPEAEAARIEMDQARATSQKASVAACAWAVVDLEPPRVFRKRHAITDGRYATGRTVKINGERVPVMKRVRSKPHAR